jgi:hypothetical protein
LSTPTFSTGSSGESGWNLKIAVLFGAVIALLIATVYLFIQVDRVQSDMTKLHDTTLAELQNVRESSVTSASTSRKSLQTMREELETARRQASVLVGEAKAEAVKRAEQLAAALAEEQRKQQAILTGQISEVRQTANDTSAKLGEVSTDVTNVKTDVAMTKDQLEKTIAELKRVNGDMGVMSGLIATNGKELSALKQLGDRNYFEFKLGRTKAPQKIGDIAVQLKKTDWKKNKYTVEVVADDKRVEKRDKNVNEPVQFYVARARQPYELVVNEIRKDEIVGYLATPKVQIAR